MHADPIIFAMDRSMAIPPDHIVKTGYVDVFACRLACRDRMAVGDISVAYQKLLQLGARAPWPCPRGHWEDETFIIVDGRHEWVASIMLGKSHIMVAWVEALPT